MKTATIRYLLMAVYTAAIVTANTLVSALGPSVTILNAFVFIGLDMTIRDYLHDLYEQPLKPMLLLVCIGSLVSYLLNTGMIAVASAVSFLFANSVDTSVYHWLRVQPWLKRVLKSNVAASGVDSVLFPLIAFGAFLPEVVLGQWVAKVVGGMVFAFAFHFLRKGK